MRGWILFGAALAGVPQQAPQARADRVVGEVARFFRGDRTLVSGFVRVPHRMLSGITLGAGGFAAYKVEIRVTDAHGAELARDAWSRQVPWQATQTPGAESVEPFAFAVAPGKYDVRIAVVDSGSGATETVDLPVTGFAARPGASDLLLAYGIRAAGAAGGDTVAAAGEVRQGDLFITSAPDLALTPSHPLLWYYCEVYRDSAGPVPWLVRVREGGANGRLVVSTPPARTAVGSGGGPIAASIDLAGLPPGAYSLTLVIGAGADTVTGTGSFRMGGFETERNVARAAAAVAEPADMAGDVTEGQLDSLFEPLVYVGKQGELAAYRGLTVQGKRRFLREFWRRREHGDSAAFYRRINEADRRFREVGGARVPGWRTDRGRVFVRYGEPDDVRREPQSGPDRPWEAWKYTKERNLKFAFLDFTRLGNYSLIYSNDKLERSPEDWTHLLSSDAINEIASF